MALMSAATEKNFQTSKDMSMDIRWVSVSGPDVTAHQHLQAS